jgi:hypothetical protein
VQRVLPAGDEVVHQLLDAGLVGDGALIRLEGTLPGRPGRPAGVDGADPGLRGRAALGGFPEIVAGPAQGLAGLQQVLRAGRAERAILYGSAAALGRLRSALWKFLGRRLFPASRSVQHIAEFIEHCFRAFRRLQRSRMKRRRWDLMESLIYRIADKHQLMGGKCYRNLAARNIF